MANTWKDRNSRKGEPKQPRKPQQQARRASTRNDAKQQAIQASYRDTWRSR